MRDQSAKRWPREGDSIFGETRRWETHAMLGGSIGDWYLRYAGGYKEAADIVIDSVHARNCSADSVGYAVLYLYRHYVELMLKGLINQGGRLQDEPRYPNIHDIKKLWEQCRPLLDQTFPDGEKADTDAVEKCMLEFATLDPIGEALRYGEDKFGQPTLPAAIHLYLDKLRDVMNGIAGFFEGSYDALDELIQCKADIDAENADF